VSAPPIDWEGLERAACEARERAYAPYSGYCVGAAVLAASGKVYAGCNVENASFGLSLCAERAAVAAMVADGQRALRAVAIVTDGEAPGQPCGMCRQVMAEFADDLPVRLVSVRPGVLARTTSLAKLLPDSFRAALLPSSRPAGGQP
jgi:cytidine deaminase